MAKKNHDNIYKNNKFRNVFQIKLDKLSDAILTFKTTNVYIIFMFFYCFFLIKIFIDMYLL